MKTRDIIRDENGATTAVAKSKPLSKFRQQTDWPFRFPKLFVTIPQAIQIG
jgi:hypothetical protein